MKAIQRINHNAAICEDGAGRQLIALGRGIGFGEMPHEVDLDVVTRTFYGIDSKYLAFIDEVDPEVLEFSAQLADIATGQLSYELSPNLPITLADHIQFAIKRAREHMVVSLPLERDLEQLHPIEYRLGELAVRGIQKSFRVRMPRSEAAGIAMSIVNASVRPSERRVLAEQHEEPTARYDGRDYSRRVGRDGRSLVVCLYSLCHSCALSARPRGKERADRYRELRSLRRARGAISGGIALRSSCQRSDSRDLWRAIGPRRARLSDHACESRGFCPLG